VKFPKKNFLSNKNNFPKKLPPGEVNSKEKIIPKKFVKFPKKNFLSNKNKFLRKLPTGEVNSKEKIFKEKNRWLIKNHNFFFIIKIFCYLND
jgi:hypothetical protein